MGQCVQRLGLTLQGLVSDSYIDLTAYFITAVISSGI